MKKYTTKTCIVNKNKTKGRKKSTNTFMIKKGICGNRKKQKRKTMSKFIKEEWSPLRQALSELDAELDGVVTSEIQECIEAVWDELDKIEE